MDPDKIKASMQKYIFLPHRPIDITQEIVFDSQDIVTMWAATMQIYRYNGQCPVTVYQHMEMAAQLAERDYGLTDLNSAGHVAVHDLHESLLGDLAYAAKQYIAVGYQSLEKRIDRAIWKFYGMDEPTQEVARIIKEIDQILCHWEAERFFPVIIEKGLRPPLPRHQFDFLNKVYNELCS